MFPVVDEVGFEIMLTELVHFLFRPAQCRSGAPEGFSTAVAGGTTSSCLSMIWKLAGLGRRLASCFGGSQGYEFVYSIALQGQIRLSVYSLDKKTKNH